MGVTYTEEQQKVIDTHGCNLLVSAAAGSGKTAVLVERIVKMVSDSAHPVDIDRLLVVTFTNAAAAGMRERISAAISERLVLEPENEHLQKQAALLHNAQITTIDSFCLFVIRNNFHTIGLDPGFRIADEGELKLLRGDVLSDVLEQCYQKGEPSFIRCMEYFSTGSRDSAVEEAVLRLYDFAMSNPFPEEWLRERKKDYACDVGTGAGTGNRATDAFPRLHWVQGLMEKVSMSLQGLLDQIGQCIAICEEPDGPYMYGELLEQEKERLEKLLREPDYEKRYLLFSALSFGRLSSKKDETVSASKRELVKNTRAEIKESLQSIRKDYFALSSEEAMAQMGACSDAVNALVDLTLLFLETFAASKRDKNILDFDDIEHLALSILLRRTQEGGIEATETAMEYRSHFTEILIDEYQDSNLVQEYLLSAISGEAEGRFNRFMVGDVKQSIYKFRLARPELFMEKYHTYQEIQGADALRIDLHKNFRSREEVLVSTNAVFSQVMRTELGGIAYDEKAALYPGASYPGARDLAAPDSSVPETTASGAASLALVKEAFENVGNDTEVLLFVEDKTEQNVGESVNRQAGETINGQAGEAVNGKAEDAINGQAGVAVNGKAGDAINGQAGVAINGKTEEAVSAATGQKNISEIIGREREVSAKRQEAYGIADKIKELVSSFQITDKDTGELRLASYKDIVILLRTTAGWDEEFKQILEEEGIPVHVSSKTGYFAATEIQELLHFLRVLDNPLQDIPFYGVLHSYFGGFSEEEIASVKAAYPQKRYLYDAVKEYAVALQEVKEVCQEPLQQRLQAFLNHIERYREIAVYMPVHELLQTIIREYDYLSFMAAKPGGSRRRANVEMLLIKAADYEKTSYYGLYHFLRYIEQLEKYDVDYGEANLQDENADVVRIMSIHKSKGLEFPVCFVAGIAKSFNMRDAGDHLVMDVEQGIGVDYVNPELRVSSRNLRRNFIALGMRQENLAEELRILYVAMTRAKEKLILTGVLKRPEKKIPSLALLRGIKERVFSYHLLMQMGSFLDVILYIASRNRCFDNIWRMYGVEPSSQNPLYEEDWKFSFAIVSWEDTMANKVKETLSHESDRRRLLLADTVHTADRIDKRLMTMMSERFSFRYPHENLKDLYTKTTVSELKKAGMKEETDFSFTLYEEEPIVPYLPKFIKHDESVSGADRGSAFHKVMELLDFRVLTDWDNETEARKGRKPDTGMRGMDKQQYLEEAVKEQLAHMLAEGKLSQGYYDAVSVRKIVSFLNSKIAKRMADAAAAGKLYREQPFVLGLPANRLNESFPPEETVLIQGIIDVFFEEKGSYIVVDYKTDAVKTPDELIRRYQTQLDYYAEALEQLSGYKMTGEGVRTAEKVIYSFKLEQEINLDLATVILP